MEILNDPYEVDKWARLILQERTRVMDSFRLLDFTKKIYPTDANFFLVEVDDAQRIYDYLVSQGIIVRNRNRVTMCGNCLRITIGSKTENSELLAALRAL